MTTSIARGRRFGRLGWATPALAVGATAVALGVAVGPTLGAHVALPKHIVLSEPVPGPSTAPPVTTPSPKKPAPRATGTPAPSSAPVVRVVPPVRPVVSAPADDRHDDGSRDVSGGDG